MLLIMFIQLMAIFTFTLIKDKIFSLYYDIELLEVIKDAVNESEMFVQAIDLVMLNQFKGKKKKKQIP